MLKTQSAISHKGFVDKFIQRQSHLSLPVQGKKIAPLKNGPKATAGKVTSAVSGFSSIEYLRAMEFMIAQDMYNPAIPLDSCWKFDMMGASLSTVKQLIEQLEKRGFLAELEEVSALLGSSKQKDEISLHAFLRVSFPEKMPQNTSTSPEFTAPKMLALRHEYARAKKGPGIRFQKKNDGKMKLHQITACLEKINLLGLKVRNWCFDVSTVTEVGLQQIQNELVHGGFQATLSKSFRASQRVGDEFSVVTKQYLTITLPPRKTGSLPSKEH